MKDPVDPQLDRRDILMGGILLGIAGLLPSCANGSRLPPAQFPDTPRGGTFSTATGSGASPPPYSPPPSSPSASSLGVIPRSRWTNEGILRSRLTANGDGGRMGQIVRITVHHDALDNSGIRTESDAAQRMATVRRGHMTRHPDPFADIGYHYVIDPQGRVWEGRSIAYQGAHVKGQNEGNLGIMVMGNFDTNRPTSAALATLDAFVVQQMHRYNVPLAKVKTHQEMAPTECPGRNLQRQMIASRGRGGGIYRA